METTARYYLAKNQSLSNAAEFIRSHGEEGFSFTDKKLDKLYKRENEKLAKQLDARADIFDKKYIETGIEIECTIDDNY